MIEEFVRQLNFDTKSQLSKVWDVLHVVIFRQSIRFSYKKNRKSFGSASLM